MSQYHDICSYKIKAPAKCCFCTVFMFANPPTNGPCQMSDALRNDPLDWVTIECECRSQLRCAGIDRGFQVLAQGDEASPAKGGQIPTSCSFPLRLELPSISFLAGCFRGSECTACRWGSLPEFLVQPFSMNLGIGVFCEAHGTRAKRSSGQQTTQPPRHQRENRTTPAPERF